MMSSKKDEDKQGSQSSVEIRSSFRSSCSPHPEVYDSEEGGEEEDIFFTDNSCPSSPELTRKYPTFPDSPEPTRKYPAFVDKRHLSEFPHNELLDLPDGPSKHSKLLSRLNIFSKQKVRRTSMPVAALIPSNLHCKSDMFAIAEDGTRRPAFTSRSPVIIVGSSEEEEGTCNLKRRSFFKSTGNLQECSVEPLSLIHI